MSTNNELLQSAIQALQIATQALVAMSGNEQQATDKPQAALVPEQKVTCKLDGCNSPIIYKDGMCYQHHKKAHAETSKVNKKVKDTPAFVTTGPSALLDALKVAKVGEVIYVSGSKRNIHAKLSAFKARGGATWDSSAWVNRVNDTYKVGKKVFRFDNRLVWEGHRSFTRIK